MTVLLFFSGSWRIGRGVRQGGVTSAILFNIYIDDILSEISANNISCRLSISKVNIQAPSVLPKLLDRISILLEQHQLKINANKTNTIVFNKEYFNTVFRFKNEI